VTVVSGLSQGMTSQTQVRCHSRGGSSTTAQSQVCTNWRANHVRSQQVSRTGVSVNRQVLPRVREYTITQECEDRSITFGDIYNVLYIEFLLVKCAFVAEILILGYPIDFLVKPLILSSSVVKLK